MNNFLLNATMIALTLLSTTTYAVEMDTMFYWSNANGLVKADHCKLEVSQKPKLGFVKSASSIGLVILERNQKLSNLSIVPGSMVKIEDIDSSSDGKTVEVVGVNAVLAPSETDAERGDTGIIDINNLESLSKNFIQIKNDYLNVTGETFWKVYGEDKFVKLNCPEFTDINDYFVFNVYPKNGGRTIARVGVSSSETELFKNIQTFEDTIIYNKFSEMLTDKSNSLEEISTLLKVNSPTVKEDVPPVKPDTPIIDETIDHDEGEDSDEVEEPEEVTIQVGTDSIVCTEQSSINVRNKDLTKVLFTVRTGERVKTFQGWGDNTIEGVINGKKYTFIKVEFLDKENQAQKIGYVVSSYVKAKSACKYGPTYKDSLRPANTTFKGLNDKNCCNFPTLRKVTTKFNEGQRRYGGSRGGGARAHAAVDLYRFKNEPIFSVAPGVVIRGLYYFYQDTFALEVLHSGDFVVRYGELTGKMAANVALAKQVKMGDRLGYIGKVNSGCCEPMLHFELYSGSLIGPLTQPGVMVNGVLFHRRKDLVNPTSYMLKWQAAKF